MSDPFCRVYWRLADEYPAIWRDDATLATYLRLLRGADAIWPAHADIPRRVSEDVLTKLVDAGLVLLDEDGDTYTIRGLHKDRLRRSIHGRHAADVRHSNAPSNAESSAPSTADSNAISNQPTRPTNPTIPATDPQSDCIDLYYTLTIRPPSRNVADWLDRLMAEYGNDTTAQEMVHEWQADPDIKTFLGRVQTRLESASRRQAKAEDERRRKSAAEAQRKERERIESMPEEERKANMDRLRASLAKVGLAT